MKVKKYLSVLAVACAGALTLAGCSDYDNGYTENAIKFTEAFKEKFGEIDPEQDWNLAERAMITVNTQKASNIKIYAQRGSEYAIVGDYQDVMGTQMLGVDVIEGTQNLLVSDGRTAQKCAPGDVVVFNSMSTRTVHEDTNDTNPQDGIKITKLTGPVSDLGDGKTYPKYRYSDIEEYNSVVDASTGVVAEGKVNLSRVVNNFSYVSNGPFIVYPYYWQTSSKNTVGIYYYDDNGERHEVPVYTMKEGDELFYENALNGENETKITEEADETKWYFENGTHPARNTWSTEENGVEDGLETPFVQYHVASEGSTNLSNAVIRHETIEGLDPGHYIVKIHARMFNERNTTNQPAGVTFTANGEEYPMSKWRNPEVISYKLNNKTFSSYVRHGDIELKEVQVGSDGKLDLSFTVSGAVGNWLAFKDLEVIKMGSYVNPGNANSYSAKYVRGQGIKIDIEPGRKFGMYLHSVNTGLNIDITYYSEAERNSDASKYGVGWNYKGSGDKTDKKNWERDTNKYPCYASTFSVNGQMFFGFEDWSEPTGSDMDLNDMVLAISGFTPQVINEDPETNTWMLACEDLGGSFDIDYNDLVFKVDYTSGHNYAKVTPLAAGGTLASYIFNVPANGEEQCLGEIHQLFGFQPAVSGEYKPHNADASRGTEGQTVTITVPTTWSMAYYSTNSFGQGNAQGASGYQNMGGFEIRTLPAGHDPVQGTPSVNAGIWTGASTIAAPDPNKEHTAPFMLCIPYSYVEENTPEGYDTETYWAWPQELMPIDECYPDFMSWVGNHWTSGEWYKNIRPNAATVSELKISRPRVTVKKPSPLSNLGDWTIEINTDISFYDRLAYANFSTGEITYAYKFSENGEETSMGTNPDITPGRLGTRWVVVRQAADDNYEAGQTVFKLIVKKPSTLSSKGDIVIAKNETVKFADYLNNANESTGAITYDLIYNNQKYENFGTSIAPNSTGDHKIVVTQAADDTHFAGTTEFTIHVYDPVMFTTNNGSLALAYDGGVPKLKTKSDTDNKQKWILVPVPDPAGYYYLYNVGAKQYLVRIHGNSWDGTFISNVPSNNEGRFIILDHNGGKAIRVEINSDRAFKGGMNDGAVIGMNGYSNEWITFSQQGTSYTSPSAKKRQ